jgi:hypothetical protein
VLYIVHSDLLHDHDYQHRQVVFVGQIVLYRT